jgi:hypothetical protein
MSATNQTAATRPGGAIDDEVELDTIARSPRRDPGRRRHRFREHPPMVVDQSLEECARHPVSGAALRE